MNSDSIPRGSAFSDHSREARPVPRHGHPTRVCGGQLLRLACCTAILCSALEAQAQAGDGLPLISPAHPVWLLEQGPAEAPIPTARTYGESAYGDYRVNATLAITCHAQHPAAGLSLQIAPSALGFDSGPFEGPDATAHGPLRIVAGTRAAFTREVSGIWTDGGAFQVGSVFAVNASIPRDALAYWASDASRGQPLRLSLAPAKAGGKPLTATFSLPRDNAGLKKILQPCVAGAAVAAPAKP